MISKTRVELPRRCRQGDLVMPSKKRVRDVRVNAVSTCRLAFDSEKTSDHRGCCWRRESCVTEASATDVSRGCNFFYTLVRWPEGMQKSARKLDQWARSWLRARAAPGRWSGALESVLVERHGTIPGREGVFALHPEISVFIRKHSHEVIRVITSARRSRR
jgi:hypothetical protein